MVQFHPLKAPFTCGLRCILTDKAYNPRGDCRYCSSCDGSLCTCHGWKCWTCLKQKVFSVKRSKNSPGESTVVEKTLADRETFLDLEFSYRHYGLSKNPRLEFTEMWKPRFTARSFQCFETGWSSIAIYMMDLCLPWFQGRDPPTWDCHYHDHFWPWFNCSHSHSVLPLH